MAENEKDYVQDMDNDPADEYDFDEPVEVDVAPKSQEGKKPDMDYWDADNRRDALNMACATLGASGNPTLILDSAEKFFGWIKEGKKAAVYPFKDDDGNTYLAEGVVLTADNNTVIVGRNIYRFVQTVQSE